MFVMLVMFAMFILSTLFGSGMMLLALLDRIQPTENTIIHKKEILDTSKGEHSMSKGTHVRKTPSHFKGQYFHNFILECAITERSVFLERYKNVATQELLDRARAEIRCMRARIK